jgi:hypothetical protein
LTSRTYSKSTPEEEAVLDTINALTRGSDEAIRALSHASCEEAIREMAAGVAARFGTDDEVGGAIAQGQLATAILKWSLTNGL